MENYIKLVGLKVENPTKTSATFTDIHGNKITRTLESPAYDSNNYLVCKALQIDHTLGITYLDYGNDSTGWFHNNLIKELDMNNKKEEYPFKNITSYLNELNESTPSTSYNITVFSDGSGRVESDRQETFYFDSEAEFVSLKNKKPVFDHVRKTWLAEGLTDGDVLNFLGKSID